jgi:nitrate reductase NapD
MHIAGVVVQTRPEHLDAVATRLDAIAGVELHATHPAGRLVVTIERDDRAAVAEALTRLHTLDGVLSACMVYEQSDYESESENVETPQ